MTGHVFAPTDITVAVPIIAFTTIEQFARTFSFIMKTLLYLILFLFAQTSICESRAIIDSPQRIVKGNTVYHLLVGQVYDFTSTSEWCQKLNGHLPYILSKEELNILAEVTVKDRTGQSTWMGLKKENGKCSNWLNGTPVEVPFTYHSKCTSCNGCCAMVMWDDKKMGFQNCNSKAKAVCVQDKNTTLEINLQIPEYVHWTSFVMLLCLAVIGYFARGYIPISVIHNILTHNTQKSVANENRSDINRRDPNNVNPS